MDPTIAAALIGVAGAFVGSLATMLSKRLFSLGDRSQSRLSSKVHALSQSLQELVTSMAAMETVVHNLDTRQGDLALRLHETHEGLTAHKLYAANNYVTGTWLKEAIDNVMREVKHVSDKIDLVMRPQMKPGE